jgi:dUTP pyrophosphatase
MEREPLVVAVEVLPHGEGLDLPAYATGGSSGMDLRAAVKEPVTLPPGGRRMVPTGIRVAIPAGFEWQIRPRSGLAVREGVTVLNAPGTVDADYRGEVKVVLVNLGGTPVEIRRGDRIAQAVIAGVDRAVMRKTDSLPESDRGSGGFGHTGRQ